MHHQPELTPGQSSPKVGQLDLIKEALCYEWNSVLDVGAGTGWVSEIFLRRGKKCSATWLLTPHPDIEPLGFEDAENMPTVPSGSFDAVWASHVLEHCFNPGLALGEFHRVLKPGGYLFLSVPPYKSNIVGGHLSTGWNIGQLAYCLALSKFDAKKAHYVRHGYNVCAIAQSHDCELPDLIGDTGDLETLTEFLPDIIVQDVNGDLPSLNWNWRIIPELDESKKQKKLKHRLLQAMGIRNRKK